MGKSHELNITILHSLIMIKKCTKTILAIVAIVGLAVSCGRDTAVVISEVGQQEHPLPGNNGQEVGQRNGWLSFSGMEAFEATMAKLHAAEQGVELDNWEKQFKGFTSWRSAEIVGEEQETETRVDIPDVLLTTILNDKGRIQIADTVYQLAADRKEPVLFAISVKQEIPLLKGAEPVRIAGVVAHKIGLHLMPFFPTWEDNDRVVSPYPVSDICNFPSQILFPWWGQKGGLIYNDNNGNELSRDNGRNVRIDYHRWRVGFLFYSSAGVRVKLYKNTRLGGWMSTIKMNSASIQACSKGLVIIPGLLPIPYNAQVSASASNANSLERTLKWAVAPMHIEVVPHHFNFNFSINYRGQQISRAIRE
ncbi:MAG: hypothetical protein BGO31_05405 [Bacteroidetes bacterium 43-16]|nr:MAG: hypothetical protein BGO31_05405 [Bacteroidetes bacterium 43-16]